MDINFSLDVYASEVVSSFFPSYLKKEVEGEEKKAGVGEIKQFKG